MINGHRLLSRIISWKREVFGVAGYLSRSSRIRQTSLQELQFEVMHEFFFQSNFKAYGIMPPTVRNSLQSKILFLNE